MFAEQADSQAFGLGGRVEVHMILIQQPVGLAEQLKVVGEHFDLLWLGSFSFFQNSWCYFKSLSGLNA